jgi:maltose O-acetyltransferase
VTNHLARRIAKLLGRPVANAGPCPRRLRTALLRLAGWEISPDAVILSADFLHGRVTIGPAAIIAQQVFFHDHERITIGRRAWIGPRCALITQTHEIGGGGQRASAPLVSMPVTIGDGCWLGANVTVLPGVTIGAGCVIAAGAVVTRDCEPDGLYAGVPAVRKRDLGH